ncbi:OmpL47-type beta-barrel domain-containing protein [Pelotomaculum propionicicum]|uniref:OmpL47-type beta-barrel domain-containing protein n=1 Tax=Pelotomaculum propionicicum TaxID=258475 RepID=UPI003B7C4488
MGKVLYRKISFLVTMLLVLQLVFPVYNTFASSTGNDVLPPSNLAYQMQSPDDVKLTWSPVTGSVSYHVYEITDGRLISLDSTTSTSYTINDLEEGSYRYVVTTLSAYGESGPCAPVTVDIVYPGMAAPALTKTFKNGNDIVLSWGASLYAEKYNLYQIGSDGRETLLDSLTVQTHTVTNAPEGTYTYAVSAENSLYGESPLSTPLQVEVVHPVMTAPGNFTCTVTNGNDLTLKWNAVSYPTGYNIYRIIDGKTVLQDTVTGTSKTYTNMPPGDYIYEVRSYSDRFGESAEGSRASLTLDTVTLAAPANFTYKIQNANDVVLTWSSATNATGYRVYQVIDGQKVLKSSPTGTSVTYAKQPEGNYIYEVHSYSDRFGESAEGSQLSFTIGDLTMTAPANFTYRIQNVNDVVLTWDAVPNATKYKVYQVIDGQKNLKSSPTGTSVTYTKLPAGDYIYEVHSYNDRFGESAEGSQVAFTISFETLAAPANLAYTVQNGNDVILTWTTVTGANGYRIYLVKDGLKELKTPINTGTVTSVKYTNRPEGDYTYEVHSYSDRFGESAEGSLISFSIDFPEMQPPSNLIQTINSATSFTLTWDISLNATDYKIYQIVNGQKNLKYTVTGTAKAFTNMPPGEYTYEIYSYSDRFGESLQGSRLTVTLTGQTMETPANLTYSIANGNDITLKWNKTTYATGYNVYQVVDGQKNLITPVTGTGPIISKTFTNKPAGDYYYIVHSYSTLLGESPEGAEITFSLVHPVMAAPSNVTYTIKNGNDIVLTWTGVDYTNKFNVYELVDGQKELKTPTPVAALTTTITRVPYGEHTYVVHSVSDRFGQSPEGRQVSLTLQEQIMKAPANLIQTITNGNNITLKWDRSTNASGYKVFQMVNGEKILKDTLTGIDNTTITYPNMPEGDYVYEVYSYSSRFGESPEGSTVSFTLVFPTMQPPANLIKSITAGNDINLGWDKVLYAAGYNVYQVVNGEKILAKTLTGFNSNAVTFKNMPEGDYIYEVHSYSNRFGESPAGSTVSFTLVWPVVQPPVLTWSIYNVNNITLYWQKVTWANEYRVYEVTGSGRQLLYNGKDLTYILNNLSEAVHSFEVTAYSTEFGESAPSSRLTENIIYPTMQPPEASVKLLSKTSAQIYWDFITYANGYNVYEIIDGKIVPVTKNVNDLYYIIDNLSYKDHEFYVTSYSNSFGESAPSNTVIAKLIVDTEAPETTAEAPTGWVNQSASVTLSATDNETGVAKTYYSVNGSAFAEGTSFIVDTEGVSSISFYSVDNVGNIEQTQTVEVKIDRTAPVTTSNVPAAWSKEDAVRLTAADSLSGVANTYYSVNGGAFTGGASFTVDTEGVNSISFYSVDNAGNIEQTQTVEVKIDRTAPVTTSNVPAAWSKEDAVRLTAADSLSGVANTYYSVNGGAFTGGASFTVDTEGVNSISFYSVDNAGNIEQTQTVEVKIDRTAPVTTSNVPAAWSKEDVVVTLAADDTLSGVAKTFYAVNGSGYAEGTTFTVSKEGFNQVSYYSVDNAGNVEAVNAVEVKIDKTAPVVTMDLNDEYPLGASLQLTYSADDSISGIASETMTVFKPGEAAGSLYANGATIVLDKPGVYNVTVTVTDAAGLSATVQEQFTVYIPGTIEVTPKVMNDTKGVFTVRVNLPAGFRTQGFDLNTARLNGVSALTSNKGYYNQAKIGQFNFERSDFKWTPSEVTVEFRGYVNGTLVIGQTTVKVQK